MLSSDTINSQSTVHSVALDPKWISRKKFPNTIPKQIILNNKTADTCTIKINTEAV
jgi:hypothetical protein